MVIMLLESMASRGYYRPRAKGLLCYLQVMLVCAVLWADPSFAGLQRLKHAMAKNGSLSFLVVGDWGRKGHYNQSRVAYQMGNIGERLDIDFIISTGDNFYDNGLKNVFDPSFTDSFKNIYTAKSLQKKWYSVLGNHDYRGDAAAQLSPILRIFDKRWLCLRSFILNTDIVEFFFVDTTPFVDKYFVKKGRNYVYDWKGVLPRRAYLDGLLQNVDSSLRKSNATWKIVVGHHTMKSVGRHGGTPELIKSLLPILKDNKVDFYINGHDHCLEHITSLDGSIQYLTSGGGSRAWRGEIKHRCGHSLKFYHDGQGFLSMEMNETDAVFTFYDVFGKMLHQSKKSKPLHSAE